MITMSAYLKSIGSKGILISARFQPPEIILAAHAGEQQWGCPASVTLAQWALESAYGKHLAAPNNYFGIKWIPGIPLPHVVRETYEMQHGILVKTQAAFCSFPSIEWAFRYHARCMLNVARLHCKGFSQLNDREAWLNCAAAHWATDPQYVTKLRQLIAQFDLGCLDYEALTGEQKCTECGGGVWTPTAQQVPPQVVPGGGNKATWV